MTRSKVNAKKKKTIKRQNKSSNFSHIESLIKEFRAIPNKIAAHSRTELGSLKQQEKKIAIELKNSQKQKKSIQMLVQTKKTPKVKKQFANLEKVISQLSAKLTHIHSQQNSLQHQQTKYLELGKTLLKLEKQTTIKSTKPKMKKQKQSVSKKMPEVSAPSFNEMIIPTQEIASEVITTESVELNS